MDEIKVSTIDELIMILNGFPNHFIYRGHADASWKLASSLERVIGLSEWSADKAKLFEDRSLDVFKSKFHLYDHQNIIPNSKLGWLALMQHYGVPTRLVDFTESPYVALYFALESYNHLSQADFAIYAIDYKSLRDESIRFISKRDSEFNETEQSIHTRQDFIFDSIVDRFSYEIAWITEPDQLNARIDRQAGSFLVSGNKGIAIEEILAASIYSNTTLQKITVDHKLYQAAFALLRKMNITSKSLYGDLNGLAQSIRMEMQAYSI